MRIRKLYVVQLIAICILTFSIIGLCNSHQAPAESTVEESGTYYNGNPAEDKPLAGMEEILARAEPTPVPVAGLYTEPELDAPDGEPVSIGTFELTAYCSCEVCCGKWSKYNLTASGTKPQEGRTVAVDTEIIPLGTSLVMGGKEHIAEDTGSAVQGNVIDLYFDSHEAAVEFGRQEAEVFVKN